MSRAFEELDRQSTPIGEISLRRRLEPQLQVDVWEVKIDEDFLMSSLFTAGEEALADLGLAACVGDDLDVVVGGLGLGHTAMAALRDQRVGSMWVIDALAPVISWHERHLTPLGAELSTDGRCHFVLGDFFEMVADGLSVGEPPVSMFDAVLLDVDHSPRHLLTEAHAPFYEPDGIARLAQRLRPAGVFALWSNDPPDAEFLAVLNDVFADASAELVTFPNFYTGVDAQSTIYVATTP